MSSRFLGYLTISVFVLGSACDASVFDTTAVKQTDAGADASRSSSSSRSASSDAGARDAGARDAGTAGKGGSEGTHTGMSMIASGGKGGSSGAAGKPSTSNAAGTGSSGDAAAAGAAGHPDAMNAKCNMSCNADHAQGTCKDGKCVLECQSSYADCNGDIAKAASGDGCETTLANNSEHCGACDNTCRAPEGALSQCREATCQSVRLVDEPAQMLTPHGTPIDNVTTQLCHAGSVVTGIEGFVVDSLIADSIRIICSPLTLSGSASAPSIAVGKASVPVPEFAGGNNRENLAQNPTPMPYKLSCGSGEVLRQLRVTVWGHWGDANGQRYDTLKDFAIACARPEVKDGKVGFGALGELKTTSATLQDAASPTRDEIDVCGDNEAFLGFNIGFGSNIDRLTSLCSSWTLTSDG